MRGMHGRLIAAAALLAASTACSKTQTDRPVVSTTGTGAASTSASGDSAAARGKSMVRLVNAVPGQNVDVTGDELPVFTGIAWKTVTPYVEVRDNVVKFRLRAPGRDSTLAENTETLADGHRYTIVVLPGEHGERSMRVLRDEVVPDPGKARIRVVNAAPDLGQLDVAVAGARDALFDDVDYGHEAGPKDVDPMAASIDIRSDRAGSPVRVRNMTIAAGRSYTIVVAGRRGGFETITFDDAVAGLLPGPR
jgi:hypothetical protein